MRGLKVWVLMLALLTGVGSAQGWVVGVTYDGLRSVGGGVGVALDVPVWEQSLGDRDVWVGVRGDLFAPLTFDLPPSTVASLTLRLPDEAWEFFAGVGVGLWFDRVDGVPCWDFTPVVHLGLDAAVMGGLRLRGEVQGAPLLGQVVVRVGLAHVVPGF